MLSWGHISLVIAACIVLLGVAMAIVEGSGRASCMVRKDRLALLFRGSTKSLATGLPMTGILVDRAEVALIILPLMLYHLIQLTALAVLSQRSAAAVVAAK